MMKTPLQFNGVAGSAGDILLVMFGPKQQDSHVVKYRWHLRLLEADRRSAAVDVEVQRINARYRSLRVVS